MSKGVVAEGRPPCGICSPARPPCGIKVHCGRAAEAGTCKKMTKKKNGDGYILISAYTTLYFEHVDTHTHTSCCPSRRKSRNRGG